jgi:hypothetical protein
VGDRKGGKRHQKERQENIRRKLASGEKIGAKLTKNQGKV